MRNIAKTTLTLLALSCSAFAYAQMTETDPPVTAVPAIPEESNADASSTDSEVTEIAEQPGIVVLAEDAAGFSTLVSLLRSAELAETMSGPGPFTVFAPTDNAFGDLEDTAISTLTDPDNKSELRGLLLYHVVAGQIDETALRADIEANQGYLKIETLGGQVLKAVIADDDIYLIDGSGGTAKIVTSDLEARNGVIHAVNQVLKTATPEN